MIIISCSHGIHLGSKIAKKLKAKHSKLIVDKFPDGELYIRFLDNVKNKVVVLVQSFYGNIQDCIIEAIFAAHTAIDLGAKKVILAAPYFPYFRQDARFHRGDTISINAMASLVDRYFDAVAVMDPHLHRKNMVSKIFKIKAIKLSANRIIASYIKSHFKNPALIGPDEESYKWAKHIAEEINVESYIYKKKRYSSYHVKVSISKKLNIKDKEVIIVDDIVSTGHTILETIKNLSKQKPKSISCICVHGIFAGDILDKLRNKKINIISTNTIPSVKSKIDVSGEIASAILENIINHINNHHA